MFLRPVHEIIDTSLSIPSFKRAPNGTSTFEAEIKAECDEEAFT